MSKLGSMWNSGCAVLRARWYLRHATRLGKNVRVWGRPFIHHNGGQMLIGDRVRLVSHVAALELGVSSGGTLDIGESTYINYGSSIAASKLVRIGPRCNIGSHVMIIDNDFHRLEPERRNERPESAPIVLGENVWLGSRVIVLPGVTIGADSVVGAGSVVTKDVPPRTLAAGVPARVIRQL
jgi:acetyltransferase-like isoleucine patch superfamily enzyme